MTSRSVVVRPSVFRNSQRQADQISPSSCTSPAMSLGYFLLLSTRRRLGGSAPLYAGASQLPTVAFISFGFASEKKLAAQKSPKPPPTAPPCPLPPTHPN